MTAVWVTIAALAVATALIKAAGPVLLGGRAMPPLLERLIALLPAALLAALVVTETFGRSGGETGIALDARAAGVLAAAVALALRASIVVAVVAAPGTAALVRAVA